MLVRLKFEILIFDEFFGFHSLLFIVFMGFIYLKKIINILLLFLINVYKNECTYFFFEKMLYCFVLLLSEKNNKRLNLATLSNGFNFLFSVEKKSMVEFFMY